MRSHSPNFESQLPRLVETVAELLSTPSQLQAHVPCTVSELLWENGPAPWILVFKSIQTLLKPERQIRMLRREGRWVDDRSTNLRIHVQTREEGPIFRTWANSEELAETFQETDIKEKSTLQQCLSVPRFLFPTEVVGTDRCNMTWDILQAWMCPFRWIVNCQVH